MGLLRHKTPFSLRDRCVGSLGLGISGSVALFRAKNGPLELYVVKTYHAKEKYENTNEYRARVLHEYEVLVDMDHVNVIKVFQYRVLLGGSTIRIFMEAGSPDLYQLLRKRSFSLWNRDELMCFFRQFCSGVGYLHSKNYCHRDIKLENAVLDASTGFLKIIDFATAVDCSAKTAVGLVGSGTYVAPETIAQFTYDGLKADVWSLAVVLHFFNNKLFPWKSPVFSDEKYTAFAEAEKLLRTAQKDQQLQKTDEKVILRMPSGSHALARRMFQPEAELRCTIDEVLRDEWLELLPFCSLEGKCGVDHGILARSLDGEK